MSLFCYIPTKLEDYAIASRRLTAEELTQVVHEVYDDSLIWHEDPRSWLTYGGFLGMQISKASFRYSIGHCCPSERESRQEINDFVEACQNYALANGEQL